jgi:tetratricopeptide (TPR) repeat protein
VDILYLKTKKFFKGKIIKTKEDGTVVFQIEGGPLINVPENNIDKIKVKKPKEFIEAENLKKEKKYKAARLKYRDVYKKFGDFGWGYRALKGQAECLKALETWRPLLAICNQMLSDKYKEYSRYDIEMDKLLALRKLGRKKELYNEIYSKLDNTKNNKKLGELYNQLGDIDKDSQNYDSALVNYLHTVLLYPKNKTSLKEALYESIICFNKLRLKYDKIGNKDKAKLYLKRARYYCKELLRKFPEANEEQEIKDLKIEIRYRD